MLVNDVELIIMRLMGGVDFRSPLGNKQHRDSENTSVSRRIAAQIGPAVLTGPQNRLTS